MPIPIRSSKKSYFIMTNDLNKICARKNYEECLGMSYHPSEGYHHYYIIPHIWMKNVGVTTEQAVRYIDYLNQFGLGFKIIANGLLNPHKVFSENLKIRDAKDYISSELNYDFECMIVETVSNYRFSEEEIFKNNRSTFNGMKTMMIRYLYEDYNYTGIVNYMLEIIDSSNIEPFIALQMAVIKKQLMKDLPYSGYFSIFDCTTFSVPSTLDEIKQRFKGPDVGVIFKGRVNSIFLNHRFVDLITLEELMNAKKYNEALELMMNSPLTLLKETEKMLEAYKETE